MKIMAACIKVELTCPRGVYTIMAGFKLHVITIGVLCSSIMWYKVEGCRMIGGVLYSGIRLTMPVMVSISD